MCESDARVRDMTHGRSLDQRREVKDVMLANVGGGG
jgi:hypothetical protein